MTRANHNTSGHLTDSFGRTRTIKEWMGTQEITEVYSRFGDWAVTPYGLECLTNYYPIKSRQLWEKDGSTWGWPRHMSEKRWVNLADFREAFDAARMHHHRKDDDGSFQ